MKLLKLIGGFGALSFIGGMVACGGVGVIDAFDPEVQLELDIEIIEDYLADKGHTEYSTLESEVRVVILDPGTGESIEYNDIIQYDYIGSFTDDLLFDTSIGDLVLEQDILFTVDTTFLKKENSEIDSLDADMNKIIDVINYLDDYVPIYSSFRIYDPFITTHSQGGWFIQQSGNVSGFKDGVHEILDNVNLGGSGLILIPSSLAYGRLGSGAIESNTVILFEILPVKKR